MKRPTEALDLLADQLEKRLPSWLQYNYLGDPISWVVSHPFFVLLGAAVGAVVGLIQGQPNLGAVLGAAGVTAVYALVREPLDAWGRYKQDGWAGAWRRTRRNPYCKGIQVGWLADGIGDVLGPVLTTALLAWWLL